jgi:hypothetical protein|nr:MAG TPA: hypothetical protein [Caudoviricetes sp.]
MNELPLITENDEFPIEMEEEFNDGKGNDEGDEE